MRGGFVRVVGGEAGAVPVVVGGVGDVVFGHFFCFCFFFFLFGGRGVVMAGSKLGFLDSDFVLVGLQNILQDGFYINEHYRRCWTIVRMTIIIIIIIIIMEGYA